MLLAGGTDAIRGCDRIPRIAVVEYSVDKYLHAIVCASTVAREIKGAR